MYLEWKNKKINVKYMNNFYNRLVGNMFKKNINEILVFKTNSIHSFFCFEKMDIVMLDKNYKVKYIYKKFKPFKIILPKKNIIYTVELPTDTLKELKINDTMKLKKRV